MVSVAAGRCRPLKNAGFVPLEGVWDKGVCLDVSARLLVSMFFRGVCCGWLETHLRTQNSPHSRKRCRQCFPMHLLDDEEARSKTSVVRAKVNSLAHA